MRIHRVSLRDFRGVGAASIAFAPEGVTIVEGPNEVGKSTIADAIDMLIADPDSSGRARVKAAQPAGRDVGPWAEMEFDTGPYRLTYAKRWVKETSTELVVHAPVREQLAGRAAHDRVEQILAETLDAPLFAALRHVQGMPLAQADLGASTTLARALDAAAGAQAVSGDDDAALIDRIDAVRLEWTTPTGSPNRARLDLREAAEAADAGLAEARQALARQEERIDEHRRLSRDIADSEQRDPGLREARDALATELAAMEQREARVAGLDRDAEAAEARARAAAQARDARHDLLRVVDDGQQRDAATAAEAAALDERISTERESAEGAGARAGRAASTLREAEAALERAADAARAVRDAFDLEWLEERRGQVAEAEDDIAVADGFLSTCALDADLMQAIEAAVLEMAVARERARTTGADLAIRAESPQRLAHGDEQHDLAAGDELVVRLPAGEEVSIEGVARVRVRGDGAEARAEQYAADARLAALLVRAGVPAEGGVDAARDLARARAGHEQRLAAAREARARALRDLTPEEMDQKIARARDRADGSAGDGAEPPPSLDAAHEALAAATAVRDEARGTADAARAAHESAVHALADLTALRAGVQGRLQAGRERLDADRAALGAARADARDDALDSEARALGQRAAAARDLHAAEAAALHRDDPESLRVRAANARDAVERAERDRTVKALAAERLLGEIGQAGEAGLADPVDRAGAQAEQARHDLARAERQATAAELLHEVFSRHRDEARRAYVAPFRDEVERLARLVFGPGTLVEVDHATLRVVTRTRDGITVPYDALSGGAREQLAVIGRLAAAALVAGDGGAPVIIDDALGYSDAGRLEGLGAALALAGSRSQVIVLTCAPARYAGVGSASVVRLEATDGVA